jgi:hypothetical protein
MGSNAEHFVDTHKMIDTAYPPYSMKERPQNGISFESFLVIRWSIFGAFGKN